MIAVDNIGARKVEVRTFGAVNGPGVANSFALGGPNPVTGQPVSFVYLLFVAGTVEVAAVGIVPRPPEPAIGISVGNFIVVYNGTSPTLGTSEFSETGMFRVKSVARLAVV